MELSIRIILHHMPRFLVLTPQEYVAVFHSGPVKPSERTAHWKSQTQVLFWLHCLLGWATFAELLNIPWPEFPSLGIIPVLPVSQGCWKI